MMEELVAYLRREWDGGRPSKSLLEMDLTVEQFRTILTSPGMDLKNVERFVYEWRVHHTENKAIFEMWQLFAFKTYHWDDYWVWGHLHLYYKYGLL